eukprot:jgi/Picre1/29223/NNA_004615.t1
MMQNEAIYAKSKAMDVIESDIEYHFTGLGLRQQVVDPNSMKRLHRAQLPVQDSERVSDMIGKVAGIAKARQDMKAKCSELHMALEAAQEEVRIAEFARERAEALATARGHALMKCEHALSDAEEQQVQLGGLLRTALEQLGVHSPEKRMSIENRITSPAVAQHVAGTTPYSGNVMRHAHVTPPACSLLSGHATPATRQNTQENQRSRTPLSGFTVYSNALSQDISPQLYHGEDVAHTTTPLQTPQGGGEEIGLQTAERLAKMVLPHLDPEQIQSLVQYSASPQVQPVGRKTSAFDASHAMEESLRQSYQSGDDSMLIKAKRNDASPQVDMDMDEVERKRLAAERVTQKLNQKLPPELRRPNLVDLSM